jgi:hypothetical protein
MHIARHVCHPHTISLDGIWKAHQASSRPAFDLSLNPIRFLAALSLIRPLEREHRPQREI